MNEITITLADGERARLWLALIDAAKDAEQSAAIARTDEARDAREARAELLRRVAEAVR